jgi:hypothetical protein
VEVRAFLEVVQAFPAEVVGGKTCLSLRVTTKSGQFVAKLGRVCSLIATAIQAAVETSRGIKRPGHSTLTQPRHCPRNPQTALSCSCMDKYAIY